MNIAQKAVLLAAVHKVLQVEGCLLLHEVMLAQDCAQTSVDYPTPWADQYDHSHLSHWPDFMQLAHAIGFNLIKFEDNTMDALEWLHKTRNQPPPPPFTPNIALGPTAGMMSANMLRNLQQGRLQIVSASLVKASFWYRHLAAFWDASGWLGWLLTSAPRLQSLPHQKFRHTLTRQ